MARNKSLIDAWSIPHAVLGILLAEMGLAPMTAFVVIIGVELVEQGPLRKANPEFFQESPLNVLGDVVIGMGAYFFWRRR